MGRGEGRKGRRHQPRADSPGYLGDLQAPGPRAYCPSAFCLGRVAGSAGGDHPAVADRSFDHQSSGGACSLSCEDPRPAGRRIDLCFLRVTKRLGITRPDPFSLGDSRLHCKLSFCGADPPPQALSVSPQGRPLVLLRAEMANSGLQLLGFATALMGWVALVACTAMPQWQMNSLADDIITAEALYKGLWMDCAIRSTGLQNCKSYDSVLALPAALQATRALMVVSLVLGFLAIFVATTGMKCTNCGGDDKVKKARIAMAGGIVFIVAGLAALVACSWYGHQIVTDFYNPLVPMNLKYEFGPAIFIGWAGSALVILGGALLSCSCPGSEGKTGYRAPRSYPKPSSAKEYV